MKKIKIVPSNLAGCLNIVSSKSMSHRLIIAASLSPNKSKISNVLQSEDLDATINILRNLGITIINNNDNNYTIIGNTFTNNKLPLDAKESGSTLRFLIPLSWYINGTHSFVGSNSLANRPLNIYKEIANKFNYQIKMRNNEFPIFVKGPIKAGEYIVDASVSSQFITGLLFILPLLKGNSKIIFKNKLASSPYVDLTLEVLKKANIYIETLSNGYNVKGNQTYKELNETVEGDYSQAAFFLVAGLINSKITIKNLNINSLQGDKQILSIIKDANGKINIKKDNITTYKSNLKASVIDLYNIPDLGPILMVMAAVSKGKTTFLNVDRLTTKESNRLIAMERNLIKMGVEFKIDNNKAYITGVNKLKGGFKAKTYNDHRIAMAMTIAGSIASSPIIIDDRTVVNKSYPTFFEDYEKIGGIANEFK